MFATATVLIAFPSLLPVSVTSEFYYVCFISVVFLLLVCFVPAKRTFAQSWVAFLWCAVEGLRVVLRASRHLFPSCACTSRASAVILWSCSQGPVVQSLGFPPSTYILPQGSLTSSLCRDNDPSEDIDRHIDTGIMLW